MVCEPNRASNPIHVPGRTRQAQIPVEIITPSFEQHCDVGQPKRTDRAMTQKVQGKEPQIVFRAQDSHVQFAELDHLRALEDTIGLTLIEFTETHMQIYDRTHGFNGLKSSLCCRIMVL